MHQPGRCNPIRGPGVDHRHEPLTDRHVFGGDPPDIAPQESGQQGLGELLDQRAGLVEIVGHPHV